MLEAAALGATLHVHFLLYPLHRRPAILYRTAQVTVPYLVEHLCSVRGRHCAIRPNLNTARGSLTRVAVTTRHEAARVRLVLIVDVPQLILSCLSATRQLVATHLAGAVVGHLLVRSKVARGFTLRRLAACRALENIPRCVFIHDISVATFIIFSFQLYYNYCF